MGEFLGIFAHADILACWEGGGRGGGGALCVYVCNHHFCVWLFATIIHNYHFLTVIPIESGNVLYFSLNACL